MKKVLLCIILTSAFVTLSIHSIFAQKYTLKGIVKDNAKIPLDLIKVSLYKNDTTLIIQDVTDSSGYFALSIEQGTYKLILDQIGIELYKRELVLNQDNDLGQILIDRSLTLEGVTIIGKKKVIEHSFDKLIFNVENSPLKQGFSGLEVLKRSPGLRINSQGGITLRNEAVLVLVNGKRMSFSPEELTNYLTSLNSEEIKSIEIQAQGSSETEASNTGGVLNIILKRAPLGFQSTGRNAITYRDQKHSGSFNGISNQFGTEKWNLYSKINYTTNHDRADFNSLTDFYKHNGRNSNIGQLDFSNKNFNTTNGVIFHADDNQEIGAEIYYSHNIVERNGWEDLTVYDPLLSSISQNLSTYRNITNFWNATLNYTIQLDKEGSQLKFIGDAGKNTIDNRNEVDTRYSLGELPNNQNRFITDANSKFFNLQIDYQQKLKNNWEFAAGSKYSNVLRENRLDIDIFEQEWIPSEGNQHFKNEEAVIANYVTLAKQWKQKHNLKLGLRSEYSNTSGLDFLQNKTLKKNYLDWFPNLYYGYDLGEGRNLSLAYSRRITRPSFRDLNPFVIKQNDFLYQQGNPALQPEYTDKINLSFSKNKHSLSLYGSFSRDLIVGVYSAINNKTTYMPENFGRSRNIGADYSYSGELQKWLYTNLSAGAWNYNFNSGNANHNKYAFYSSLYSRFSFTKTLFLDLFNNVSSKNQFFVTEAFAQYNMDLAVQKNLLKGSLIVKLNCTDVFNTRRDKNSSYYNDFNFDFYQKTITRTISASVVYTIKNKKKVEIKSVQSENNTKGRL